jgi:hypothetical protein
MLNALILSIIDEKGMRKYPRYYMIDSFLKTEKDVNAVHNPIPCVPLPWGRGNCVFYPAQDWAERVTQ